MRNRSFTLVEVTIMGLLGFLLLAGILKVLTGGMRQAQHGMEKSKYIQALALFLEQFQREIENATKLEQTDKSEIKLETSCFSKALNLSVQYHAKYRFVAAAGNKTGCLEYTPTALAGAVGLPPDIKSKKYFEDSLKEGGFNDFKNHLSINLPDNRSGFRLSIDLLDPATKARFKFDRAFYPPLLKGNNPEDGYQSIRGGGS